MALTAATVFRDYVQDGNPASGVWNVQKADVRAFLSGVLANGFQPLSSSYTVQIADAGSTLALTSGPGTLTFGPSGGYNANHMNLVANLSLRRWEIAGINMPGAGTPSFHVWPGQMIAVANTGSGGWTALGRSRFICLSPLILNVDHARGNDANDGLVPGTGALATIQAGLDLLVSSVDCNNIGPTIQVASETFTENNVAMTRGLEGYHAVFLQGDAAAVTSGSLPTQCTWKCSSSGGGCLSCRDNGRIVVAGFKFDATGTTGATALQISQFGALDFYCADFGNFPGGYHIDAYDMGASNYAGNGGTYQVSGNCAAHALLAGNGHFISNGAAILVPNALTFTYWLEIVGPAFAQFAGATFSGAGAAGGSTGTKYGVFDNGFAQLNGATLPGATAGTTSSGGQVSP
jgi:hypothetical protein